MQSSQRVRGFSLIELIIVVVIIGILAAIAIPRLSRGSAGAADSALSGNLAVIRTGLDLYATEHAGSYPSVASFDAQMTQYTDANGVVGAAKNPASGIIYGPYMRATPKLPVGNYKNTGTVLDGTSGTAGSAAGGWFYNPTTGNITANCANAEVDAANKAYNTY